MRLIGSKAYLENLAIKAILFLMAFAPIVAKTQEPKEWLLSKILDNTTGLLQNSIGSMYFDTKTGFLWLTTESGLVRYDGVHPFIFDNRILPEMKTARMSSIFPTTKDGVLAMDRNGMLYKMVGATVVPFKEDSIRQPVYLNMHLFKGNLYNIKFANELISKLSLNKSDTVGKYNLSQMPLSIVCANDSIWVSYSVDFIHLFKQQKEIAKWGKQKSELPVLIRSGNYIYAINDNGSGYKIDPKELTCEKVRSTDSTFLTGKPNLFYDQLNNQPFVLNGSKLYKIDFFDKQISVRYIAELPDLPENIVSIIAHPTSKTIFVGSQLNGLLIYTQSPFRVYKAEGKSKIAGKVYSVRDNIYATARPDPEHLITSTSVLFNLKTGEYSVLPFTIERQRTLLLDNQKNLWYAYSDTLFKVKYGADKPDKKILLTRGKTSEIKGLNFLQLVYQSTSGKIWVSTKDFLGYIENDKLVEFLPFADKNDASYLYMKETSKGELITTDGDGLFYIDTEQKKVIAFPNIATKNIRSFYIDEGNLCWIATYGNGISMYDLTNKKFYQLPLDQNGYLLFGHVFCPDGLGNFLIPTNRGLFRINKKHLLEVIQQPGAKLFYQYFDSKSGLATNEFNGGCQPAFSRLENGDILLPSLDGLVSVNIQGIPAPRNYPIFIDKVETSVQSHTKINNGHSFMPNERNQTWHITFAQWDQAYSPGLSYKLDDNTDWLFLREGEREIQLRDLKGGRHILHIRFKAGLLPRETSFLTVPFTVGKKYYELSWFWLASFLLFGGLFFLIVRLQTISLNRKNITLEKKVNEKTKELLEKNDQLASTLLDLENTVTELNTAFAILEKSNLFMSRLIGVLGHDVMIPLQYIAKVSAQLKFYNEKLSNQTRLDTLSDISTTASQLKFFGESLIHWIKLQANEYTPVIEKFQMSKIIYDLVDLHHLLLTEKGNIICTEVSPNVYFTQDTTLVKIILHNLLKNANKFTSNGRIIVSAHTPDGDSMVIRMQDNGKGMGPEKVNSLNNLHPILSSTGTNMETGWGMGYVLIIDLLKFSNGTLHVESKENEGSIVTVTLPLIKNTMSSE